MNKWVLETGSQLTQSTLSHFHQQTSLPCPSSGLLSQASALSKNRHSLMHESYRTSFHTAQREGVLVKVFPCTEKEWRLETHPGSDTTQHPYEGTEVQNDDTCTIIPSLEQGDWLSDLDLQDPNFHLAIHSFRK